MNNIVNHVHGSKSYILTSGFRPSNRPTHDGVDFVDVDSRIHTPRGVDILAIADGTVVEYINGNLVGVTVAIAHEGKILSRYQHMRVGSVPVKVGDKVKKGQVIGVMGNTGNCISSRNLPKEYLGTHLHIGIKENSTFYNNGSWVNPVPYLTGQKQIKSSSTPIVTPPSPVPQPAQTVDFKVGDTVEIKLTAQRWASGPIMPARVKGRQYKIQQLGNNNNKLLLGADVKTGENVMSWVYEADVIKI